MVPGILEGLVTLVLNLVYDSQRIHKEFPLAYLKTLNIS